MCRISPLVLFWVLLNSDCSSQNRIVLHGEKAEARVSYVHNNSSHAQFTGHCDSMAELEEPYAANLSCLSIGHLFDGG